jgi:hypothetical protein
MKLSANTAASNANRIKKKGHIAPFFFVFFNYFKAGNTPLELKLQQQQWRYYA